jgi:hypothetical protein
VPKDKNEGRSVISVQDDVRERLDAWASAYWAVPQERLRHNVSYNTMLLRLLDIAEGKVERRRVKRLEPTNNAP